MSHRRHQHPPLLMETPARPWGRATRSRKRQHARRDSWKRQHAHDHHERKIYRTTRNDSLTHNKSVRTLQHQCFQQSQHSTKLSPQRITELLRPPGNVRIPGIRVLNTYIPKQYTTPHGELFWRKVMSGCRYADKVSYIFYRDRVSQETQSQIALKYNSTVTIALVTEIVS
jgi:hypothetical protein